MDVNVKKFLLKHQEKSEGHYTHVSQIQPTGRYKIESRDLEEFWKIYLESLHNNEDMICGLAEHPHKFYPILNDTDIKIDYIKGTHSLETILYTEEQLKEVVAIYQKHLKKMINNYEPKHGMCFVLEKEKPTIYEDKVQISHGFHLQFIYTFMNKEDQDIHLIPRVRKELKDKQLFSNIGIKNSDEVIDKTSNKFWLLYGSKKKENLQSYKLSKIYNDKLEVITLEQALENYVLLNTFGDTVKFEKELKYYLPRILSITSEHKETVSLKSDLQIIVKKDLRAAKDSKKTYDDNRSVSQVLNEAKELMRLISPVRADSENDWITIGWILHSIGDESQEALEMWLDFSSKTSRKNYYSEKSCVYKWNNMKKKTGYTIGSLKYFAKYDSPEEYKKYQKKEIILLYKESLKGGHYDMAKILHNKFSDEHICACNEKNVWYRFIDHGWVEDKQGISLKRKIASYLLKLYEDRKKEEIISMADDDDDNENQKKLKIISKIIGCLNTHPFKVNIMKECQELFYKADFAAKLDLDPELLRFTNGILDLKEMRLRPGRPDDYCNLSTDYDYVEFSSEDQEVMGVEDHLSKVFPDPELKQYFIEYCAELLRGGNSSKTFVVMSGHGDNGKSIMMDLLQLVLGRYFRSLPTSLIFGKRTQSSAATPELFGIGGVRVATLNEPNNKDVINIGMLKELTGNDTMYIRGLFKDPQNVRLLLKLIMICNKLPKLPCDDPATWNRIRVLPYESCFPKDNKNVPEDLDEQYRKKTFPRDPFFNDKLPRMKQAFMWLMFENYKRIRREGKMIEPEKVKEATILYRKNNDVFLQFVIEKIVKDTEDTKASMSLVEAYASFREWFKQSFPNITIPDKGDMQEDLLKRWGKVGLNHKWKGYRLRSAEDDEKDGLAIVLREEDLLNEEDSESDDDEEEKTKEGFVLVENEKLLKNKIKQKVETDDDIEIEV